MNDKLGAPIRLLRFGALVTLAGLGAMGIEVLVGLWNPWVMHAPIGSWVTYWTLTNFTLILGGLLIVLTGTIAGIWKDLTEP